MGDGGSSNLYWITTWWSAYVLRNAESTSNTIEDKNMSENAKYLGTVLLLTVVLTVIAGIVVFYVGSSLPAAMV